MTILSRAGDGSEGNRWGSRADRGGLGFHFDADVHLADGVVGITAFAVFVAGASKGENVGCP